MSGAELISAGDQHSNSGESVSRQQQQCVVAQQQRVADVGHGERIGHGSEQEALGHQDFSVSGSVPTPQQSAQSNQPQSHAVQIQNATSDGRQWSEELWRRLSAVQQREVLMQQHGDSAQPQRQPEPDSTETTPSCGDCRELRREVHEVKERLQYLIEQFNLFAGQWCLEQQQMHAAAERAQQQLQQVSPSIGEPALGAGDLPNGTASPPHAADDRRSTSAEHQAGVRRRRCNSSPPLSTLSTSSSAGASTGDGLVCDASVRAVRQALAAAAMQVDQLQQALPRLNKRQHQQQRQSVPGASGDAIKAPHDKRPVSSIGHEGGSRKEGGHEQGLASSGPDGRSVEIQADRSGSSSNDGSGSMARRKISDVATVADPIIVDRHLASNVNAPSAVGDVDAELAERDQGARVGHAQRRRCASTGAAMMEMGGHHGPPAKISRRETATGVHEGLVGLKMEPPSSTPHHHGRLDDAPTPPNPTLLPGVTAAVAAALANVHNQRQQQQLENSGRDGQGDAADNGDVVVTTSGNSSGLSWSQLIMWQNALSAAAATTAGGTSISRQPAHITLPVVPAVSLASGRTDSLAAGQYSPLSALEHRQALLAAASRKPTSATLLNGSHSHQLNYSPPDTIANQNRHGLVDGAASAGVNSTNSSASVAELVRQYIQRQEDRKQLPAVALSNHKNLTPPGGESFLASQHGLRLSGVAVSDGVRSNFDRMLHVEPLSPKINHRQHTGGYHIQSNQMKLPASLHLGAPKSTPITTTSSGASSDMHSALTAALNAAAAAAATQSQGAGEAGGGNSDRAPVPASVASRLAEETLQAALRQHQQMRQVYHSQQQQVKALAASFRHAHTPLSAHVSPVLAAASHHHSSAAHQHQLAALHQHHSQQHVGHAAASLAATLGRHHHGTGGLEPSVAQAMAVAQALREHHGGRRRSAPDDFVREFVEGVQREGVDIKNTQIPVPEAIQCDPTFRPVSEEQILHSVKWHELDMQEAVTKLAKKLAEKRVFGPLLMAKATVAGTNHSNYPNLPISGIGYIEGVCRRALCPGLSQRQFVAYFRPAMKGLAARCRRIRHSLKPSEPNQSQQATLGGSNGASLMPGPSHAGIGGSSSSSTAAALAAAAAACFSSPHGHQGATSSTIASTSGGVPVSASAPPPFSPLMLAAAAAAAAAKSGTNATSGTSVPAAPRQDFPSTVQGANRSV